VNTVTATARRWTLLLVAIVACLAIVAACGAQAPGGSRAPGPATSGSAGGPTSGSVPGSSPRAGVPVFTGSATVLMEIDGTAHELTGGRCDLQEYPEDMGGGWAFAINLGTPSFEDGGPDYVGIVVDVADAAAPDGEYTDVLATASVDGVGFNIGEAVLTIRDGGTAGSLTGETRPDNKPVRATFSC
jgi:hypothetical protein